MSLKKCPTCLGQVSSSANACPHCGHNLAARRSWWWALALLLVIPAAGFLASLRNDVSAPAATASTVVAVPAQAPATPVKIEAAQLVNVDSDYRPDVAQMVELLQNQRPRCRERLEPLSVAATASQDNPANPRFFVQCGTGPIPEVIYFTWMEAVNKTFPAQPAPLPVISERAAARACAEAARAGASIPSSVDFSRIWDSAFRPHEDGTAVYISKFTAKSALGVEQSYTIKCHFDGLTLGEVTAIPSS